MKNKNILIIGIIICLSCVLVIALDLQSNIFNFTYTSPTTLTPIGNGITSLTAQTYNQSWLEFDGVNDAINTTLNLDKGNFSCSIWFNQGSCPDYYCNGSSFFDAGYNNPNPQNYSWQVRRGSGDGNSLIFFMCNDSTCSKIHTLTDGSGKTLTSIGSFNYTDNRWFNLAFTYNKTDGVSKVYMNGTILAVSAVNITNTNSANRTLKIGSNINMNSNLAIGNYDEARCYNRTISADEASQIYSSGRSPNASLPSDGLVLWYSFNENSGSIVYDKSGHGNNGN